MNDLVKWVELVIMKEEYYDIPETNIPSKAMRYFSYNKRDVSSTYVETVSEDEIRKQYWPQWYQQMCDKYEQAYVDEHYCFEDCLDDWVILNKAWEIKN